MIHSKKKNREREEQHVCYSFVNPLYVSYFITYFYFAELKAKLLKRFQRKSQMITRSRIQLQSQNFQILFPVTSNTYNHIFMTKKVIEKITNINKIWSIYQLIIFHKKSQKHPIHTLFTNLVFQKYHVYKSCNSRSYSNILCLNNIFFTNPLLEEHLVLDPKNILFTNLYVP